jgi:RNA polymerase sigma factor
MDQESRQPDEIVRRIQGGENHLRDRLIADCLADIRRLVRKTTRSFADEQDEAFSIALVAFNQAIGQYKAEMGAPFWNYAALVVKHRLFDWMRRQKMKPETVSLSACDTEIDLPLEEHLADPKSSRIPEDLEIQESLLQLELDLSRFGLTLPKLTSGFPKHQDSQLFCIRISRALAGDPPLYRHLLEKGRLPGAELARRCEVPVKTIEKNRASIILLTLLLHSDLQVIQSYIAFFEKGAAV